MRACVTCCASHVCVCLYACVYTSTALHTRSEINNPCPPASSRPPPPLPRSPTKFSHVCWHASPRISAASPPPPPSSSVAVDVLVRSMRARRCNYGIGSDRLRHPQPTVSYAIIRACGVCAHRISCDMCGTAYIKTIIRIHVYDMCVCDSHAHAPAWR